MMIPCFRRCNNYKCMFHICHKEQPIIRIDMHYAGPGDRSYPTFGDRNNSTRAFRFVWRKHANWQFLLENVLLLLIIFVHCYPVDSRMEGKISFSSWSTGMRAVSLVLTSDHCFGKGLITAHSLSALSQIISIAFLYFCTSVLSPTFLIYMYTSLLRASCHCYCSSIASIYVCVGICLNVYLHICTCVFVHLPYATTPCFRQSPQLPPLCHRYCSSIAAGTQRTHRSVAEQQLAGHPCNIYFRLHKNLAQILHKYCIFINIHAQNCTIHA